MSTIFFIYFLITIIITRAFLYFRPTSSPTIKGFRMHHWMFGLILMLIGFLAQSLVLYAVGVGLFIDELTFLLIRGRTHKDNYSVKSIIGTVIFVILVFIFKDYVIYPLELLK